MYVVLFEFIKQLILDCFSRYNPRVKVVHLLLLAYVSS
jgi:hypothetical protein